MKQMQAAPLCAMPSAPQSELPQCSCPAATLPELWAHALMYEFRSAGSSRGTLYFDRQCTICRLFQHDLEGIMPHILDPKQLKEDIKRLHEAHCGSEPSADIALEESPFSDDKQNLERWECTFRVCNLAEDVSAV